MNKVDRYIRVSVSLFLIIFSATAYGQNRIDPTLEVRRDFDAKLAEITKGKLNTSISDSLYRFDLDFNYSVFDKPVKDLYEFSPLPSANLERTNTTRYPQFYARLGANLTSNPFASIKYQPAISPKISLLIYGDHDSFYGKLPLFYNGADNILSASDNKIVSPYAWSRIGVKFEYNWEKGLIGLDADYNSDYFGLSGFESPASGDFTFKGISTDQMSGSWIRDYLSRKSGVAAVKAYVSSKNPNNNTFHYKAGVSFSSLNDNAKLSVIFNSTPLQSNSFKVTENNLNFDLSLGYGFADHSRIYVDAKYEISKYDITPEKTNLEIHPYYIFRYNRWYFELGAKLLQWRNVSMQDGKFRAHLNGFALLELVSNKLWFYAQLDNKYNSASYSRLLSINPYANPTSHVKNVEQPIITDAGFKGNIANRMSYRIYGGYEKYRNQLFFVKDDQSLSPILNGFRDTYDNESRIFVGGELFFKSKAIDAQFLIRATAFETDNIKDIHYNYSPLEISGRLRYNWRERIILAADIEYRHKTPIFFTSTPADPSIPEPGINSYIPSYAIMDIEATYVVTNNFSFFVRGNNLLNTPFSPIPFYASKGRGIGVGINIKF